MTTPTPPAVSPYPSLSVASNKSGALNDPPHPKVAAAIDAWKRKLLDLTKRNRALNFKVAKVSTVMIVDKQPAQVFNRLYLREQSMQFKALPEPADGDAKVAPDRESLESAQEDEESDTESTPTGRKNNVYAGRMLDTAQADGLLQTASYSEQLEKGLRRIDERARLTIEEQGVNTLFLALGMLYYTESEDSELVLRAPLILLPVVLKRKSALAGFTVSATDDDPLVNAALAEYLRQSFGIALPELPDSEAMPEDYDLNDWLVAATDAIRFKSRWVVKTEIYLGHFSFQKFVMYKDLEANAPALAVHRLIGLVTGGLMSEDGTGGMPSDIREMDLDRDYAPENTCQVVDADSSQLRAIAAAARNHDLVLEGPPGTGKSQTITNLIAQALAAGKTVLFVAEKMAALQVVHSRLVEAGLGECCLELHSTKANKRAVVDELARSLDVSLAPAASDRGASQRIGAVRSTLTEYVRALHAPYGMLNTSPFAAYGVLARVYAAPRIKYDGPVESLTRAEVDQAERALNDLSASAAQIGIPALHPWRDAAKAFFSEDDLDATRELGNDLVARVGDLRQRADHMAAAFGVPPVTSFSAVGTLSTVATVIASSPGAPAAVLASEMWDSPPLEATALIARGRTLVQLRARVAKRFTKSVLDRTHASDISYVEQRAHGFAAFAAFFDGRFRATKKRWMSYRLPSFRGSLIEQATELKYVDRLMMERKALESADASGRAMFGALWRGEDSSADALDSYLEWVCEFRRVFRKYQLSERAIQLAAQPSPDVSALRSLSSACADAADVLVRLQRAVGWPDNYLMEAGFADIGERVADLVRRVAEGPRWAAFDAAREAVAQGPAACLLPAVLSGEVACADLPKAFLRAFYSRWVSAAVNSREQLARFHTLLHEERLEEFRSLDKRVLLENRTALIRQVRDRVQQQVRRTEVQPAMQFLRKQMARQRGLAPLRRTIKVAGPAIRAIKPCLMMSPLTVAQYLGGEASSFDLVIFDEASQLPAEDAAGAILRGKQLIVVGDPKQLPPTNFFNVLGDQGASALADDGTPLYEDSESILEEFLGVGLPSTRLKWHYRSAHESLIHFSNTSFYDSDLYTFPSVETSTGTYGLQFEFVSQGVYEGKGLNNAEAKRVADAVVTFAKEQATRGDAGEPEWSLGVGTFNMRQQLAIQDELEQRRRNDPSLEPFFASHNERFFVKNLENIQGDERDVIFLSVTYAKGPDGKLRQNFGPLNGENGWRRLNVLVTRARRRMRVFSSMHGDEISASSTTSYGARLLREFLLYAERGHLESATASLSADTESPFEQDILGELVRRGFNVVHQVGVAGYRIDLGVLDEACPGRFLCGIECDGVAYHSSESARDRDRLRQQVLEKRGWTILRVWSTDFFKDRAGQIERLVGLIETCQQRAASSRHDTEIVVEPASLGPSLTPASIINSQVFEVGPASRTDDGSSYRQPVAAPYVFAAGQGKYAGQDITIASLDVLTRAILHVVTVESPIHSDDLMARVVGMWSTKAGRRIAANVGRVCVQAERAGLIRHRGDYFWNVAETCVVRSRAGTQIPGDRIASKEYEAAIREVLAAGHVLSRSELTSEVRSVFGFNRTGALLDAAIGAVIDRMLAEVTLGEVSTGIRLRP